jgi:uncharacterized protein YecT (DUF1311 family)
MKVITFMAAGILSMMSAWSFAQTPQESANIVKLCSQAAAAAALPRLGPVSAEASRRLRNCDPAGLYYGIPQGPDFAAARRCALFQWSQPDIGGDNFETRTLATATLAMIYANGAGVPRDIDTAIQFVCAESPEPEKDGRIEMIESIEKIRTDRARHYDFCVENGGQFWQIVRFECERFAAELKDRQRKKRIAVLAAKWTLEQKTAFHAMLRVHAAFIKASTDGESDPCVTGVTTQEIDIPDELNDQFAADLTDFERGQLPHFSHEDAVTADQRLNAAFAKMVDPLIERAKRGDDHCSKPVAPLRADERAWIAYRDAWLRFAEVRWPEVSRDSWLAFLSKERAGRLELRSF